MRTIRVAHLIPLVGYLLIRGRCPDCGARISWRYPFVEFLGGSAALLAVGLHGFTLTAMMFFVFFCFLIALAAIDLRTMYLPDALTLPFAALGIGTNLFGLFASFPAALIGAIAGGGTFWLIGAFYFKARGIDGLGLGDAKLMGGIGAWLGWTALPFVILAASVSALLFILTRRLSGWAVTRETTIPFGPFLAAGAGLIMVLHAASPAFWQL